MVSEVVVFVNDVSDVLLIKGDQGRGKNLNGSSVDNAGAGSSQAEAGPFGVARGGSGAVYFKKKIELSKF